jgi:hypothetical protein
MVGCVCGCASLTFLQTSLFSETVTIPFVYLCIIQLALVALYCEGRLTGSLSRNHGGVLEFHGLTISLANTTVYHQYNTQQ